MDKELDLSHDSESVKVDKEIRCENVKIDNESDCEHVDQETDSKNVKMESDTSNNDKVDKETDLPLMANIESVKMLNYLMELFCDFKKVGFNIFISLMIHILKFQYFHLINDPYIKVLHKYTFLKLKGTVSVILSDLLTIREACLMLQCTLLTVLVSHRFSLLIRSLINL